MMADPGMQPEYAAKTLCILGAGLSALILLRCLVRRCAGRVSKTRSPLSVVIIDETGEDQFGRGLAYTSPWSRQHPYHRGSRAELLNSPAVRMNLESIIGLDGDFVQWLKHHPTVWQQLLGLVKNPVSGSFSCRAGSQARWSGDRG
jgi:uncharacterized NAD(P)/FAD-binding protein YdhS